MPTNNDSPPYLNPSLRPTPNCGQLDPDFPDFRVGDDIPLLLMPPGPRPSRYRRNIEVPRQTTNHSDVQEDGNPDPNLSAITLSTPSLRVLNLNSPSHLASKKVKLCIFSHVLKAYCRFSGRIMTRMRKNCLHQSGSASR